MNNLSPKYQQRLDAFRKAVPVPNKLVEQTLSRKKIPTYVPRRTRDGDYGDDYVRDAAIKDQRAFNNEPESPWK